MSRYVIAAAVLLVSLAAAYPQPYEAWSLPNVPLSALENLAASNDTVYFGGADAVYAYNVMDGAPLHKIKYGANGPYSVLAAGPHGWLYVAVNSSAYGYQNGIMKWNTTTVRNTQGSVVTLSPDFTKIAMVFRDAHVMVFNALTGTVIFRYDADNAGGTTPVGAVFGGRAVVVSGGGGDIVAFDSATGHGIWRYSTGLSEIPCSLGVTEDGLYAVVVGNVGSTEFTLLVINIETAVVNATQQTRVTETNANAVWSVAVAPIPYNRAIVSTGSNVYAFDIPSMKLRWIRAVSSPEPAVPAGVHALMVVNNYVWGVDLDTGALNFAVAHATSIPEDQVKSYTGAMLAVAHSNLVPFVATSCDVTLVNGSSMQFRAVYRVPNYAVMTETQYSNDNAAPCQGASTNVVRPAVCTEDDVTQAVSSTKTWHRYYCFHNKRDVMSVKFRRYVGTSCSSAPAGGNVVYETVQYLNECVIERNFTSSELLSCVEAPY